MRIKSKSCFKDAKIDLAIFENWVNQLEKHNERVYERFEVTTSLGKTHIWGINTKEENIETLVIFPGARTSSLFWDFDKGLDNLNHKLRIYLVETNGLPNLSDGLTPDIKSLDYGIWASEVFEKLGIEKAFVAGASFGGLICMKLGIVKPELIKAAFLLNAGCLQPFSLSIKNLYYNLLPIISPSESNVSKFLDKAIFCKPNHKLSSISEKLIVDYEVFALTRYKDNSQKPYYMNEQLADIMVDTYLLQGDNDLLFPYQKSIDNAKKHIRTLKEIEIFENVGHGIETYAKAMNYIGIKIKNYS
ncbi:alpha/beta hydrolase [Flavobacterium aquariorum]|uniref:Alpha/beta hydrolase n=1 Tax=Flavobacterium aquariorum TaxID=2217670 RepID=A0A2W7TQI9_9FLAO|nr:alpha/beta hydrolase [Flavobacterium aquariorum]PZX92328.1 alpha/beta hydrolase [Flavobacterium aquariorum]